VSATSGPGQGQEIQKKEKTFSLFLFFLSFEGLGISGTNRVKGTRTAMPRFDF
jgi:hypothetical protein